MTAAATTGGDPGARGLQIVRGDAPLSPGWRAPTVRANGQSASRAGGPAGFPLWLAVGVLADGATLEWAAPHGDEVLYVQAGSLVVDGRTCPAGGAVVVEAGVAATVTAHGDATLLHFGPTDPAPPTDGPNGPAAPGTTVHVIGPGGTWAQVGNGRDSRFFGDSTCPTCRPTLLYTGRDHDYDSPAHSHSQDELIHVLAGELRLGAHRAGPGDTLAIAKDVRYRFRSGPFAFVNYRRDASHQTVDRAGPAVPEGGAVHGFTPVMDLR